MRKIVRNALIFGLFPLLASCAATKEDTSGLDWSKAQTYRVKTAGGDRVVMHVLGNEKDGYDYQAQIRRTTRTDPDPLDRQRVLSNASKVLIGRVCAYGAKETRPQFSPNNYEQVGRFVCNPR